MSADPNMALVKDWLARNNVSGIIRSEVKDILPFFLSLFILVGAVGIISNATLVVVIVRRRLYRQLVMQFIGSLGVVEIVRCVLVLPLVSTSLIVREWRLGSFLCFVWPLLLPCTIHVTVFILLAMCVFRYLKVVKKTKSPLPPWTCVTTSWLLAVAILTPHAAFKRYIGLQSVLGEDYRGLGICVLRPGASEKNKEYVISIFMIFFVGMFVTIIVFSILVHMRLKSREREFPPETNSLSMELNIQINEKETDDDEDNLNYPDSAMLETEDIKCATCEKDIPVEKPDQSTQTDLPVTSKKTKLKADRKMQTFLVLITTLFGLLWLPYYIHYQIEALTGNEEPTNYLLHMSLLLIGYLSSWSLPINFSMWQMSKATKYKIKVSLNPKTWKKRWQV